MVISSSTCSFRGIEPVSLAGEKEEIKKDEDEKGRMWTAFLRVTFNQYLSLLSSFLIFSEWDALKFPETGKILFSQKKIFWTDFRFSSYSRDTKIERLLQLLQRSRFEALHFSNCHCYSDEKYIKDFHYKLARRNKRVRGGSGLDHRLLRQTVEVSNEIISGERIRYARPKVHSPGSKRARATRKIRWPRAPGNSYNLHIIRYDSCSPFPLAAALKQAAFFSSVCLVIRVGHVGPGTLAGPRFATYSQRASNVPPSSLSFDRERFLWQARAGITRAHTLTRTEPACMYVLRMHTRTSTHVSPTCDQRTRAFYLQTIEKFSAPVCRRVDLPTEIG